MGNSSRQAAKPGKGSCLEVWSARRKVDGPVSRVTAMPDAHTAFDPRQAARLARAAAAAYDEDPAAIARALGAAEVRRFAADGVAGFTALAGDDVVVAFRGTEPGRLGNWLTNLDHDQIPAGPGRVHRGFARALD